MSRTLQRQAFTEWRVFVATSRERQFLRASSKYYNDASVARAGAERAEKAAAEVVALAAAAAAAEAEEQQDVAVMGHAVVGVEAEEGQLSRRSSGKSRLRSPQLSTNATCSPRSANIHRPLRGGGGSGSGGGGCGGDDGSGAGGGGAGCRAGAHSGGGRRGVDGRC